MFQVRQMDQTLRTYPKITVERRRGAAPGAEWTVTRGVPVPVQETLPWRPGN